jgi:hypothetical protein
MVVELGRNAEQLVMHEQDRRRRRRWWWGGGRGEGGDAAEKGEPISIIIWFSDGFAGMLGWVAAMLFDVRTTNVQASSDLRVVGSYFPDLFRIAR